MGRFVIPAKTYVSPALESSEKNDPPVTSCLPILLSAQQVDRDVEVEVNHRFPLAFPQ